jgi:hypothetical protein
MVGGSRRGRSRHRACPDDLGALIDQIQQDPRPRTLLARRSDGAGVSCEGAEVHPLELVAEVAPGLVGPRSRPALDADDAAGDPVASPPTLPLKTDEAPLP